MLTQRAPQIQPQPPLGNWVILRGETLQADLKVYTDDRITRKTLESRVFMITHDASLGLHKTAIFLLLQHT